MAAAALVVPPLIAGWSRPDPGPAVPPVTASAPAPTTARVAAIRIAAADPGNERYQVAVIACPTCASGSRVQYLGQGHAVVVHVHGVTPAGPRTLTIVYECDGPRRLDLSVNGDRTISLELSGNRSWTSPARTTVPIELPAGDTVIRFFNANDPAPDLDQIVID